MFNSFPDFRGLRIVEAVNSAYEISSDSANSLKLDTFTDLAINFFDFALIHTSSRFHAKRPMTASIQSSVHVC